MSSRPLAGGKRTARRGCALYHATVTDMQATPGRLPEPPTAFVGREEDVRQLLEMLAREECRLATLLGPGGIGKTRGEPGAGGGAWAGGGGYRRLGVSVLVVR